MFGLRSPALVRSADKADVMRMKADAVPFEFCNLEGVAEEAAASRLPVFGYLHCSRCFCDDGDACHAGLCVKDHHRD